MHATSTPSFFFSSAARYLLSHVLLRRSKFLIESSQTFWALRAKTKGKMLWLRSTGSTVVSQLVDTFIVIGIAFYVPSYFELVPVQQRIGFTTFLNIASSDYAFKLIVAIILTPLIYVGHSLIDKFLGTSEAHKMIEAAAKDSLDSALPFEPL